MWLESGSSQWASRSDSWPKSWGFARRIAFSGPLHEMPQVISLPGFDIILSATLWTSVKYPEMMHLWLRRHELRKLSVKLWSKPQTYYIGAIGPSSIERSGPCSAYRKNPECLSMRLTPSMPCWVTSTKANDGEICFVYNTYPGVADIIRCYCTLVLGVTSSLPFLAARNPEILAAWRSLGLCAATWDPLVLPQISQDCAYIISVVSICRGNSIIDRVQYIHSSK